MSRVLRNADEAVPFRDTLSSIDPALKPAHRSSSERMQSGLNLMFEKAKAEGFAAGRLEGFQVGHEDGVAKGLADFEEAHQQAIHEFRQSLEDFVAGITPSLDAWYQRAEERLSTLAVEIARRALCQELSLSRESIVEITKQALQEVRHGTEVRVRVSPIDSSVLESRKAEILEAVSNIRQLIIVPDLKIVSGCEVDTDGGVIDARVESYLARLEEEAA